MPLSQLGNKDPQKYTNSCCFTPWRGNTIVNASQNNKKSHSAWDVNRQDSAGG